MTEFENDIFISYNKADEEFAEKIVNRLEKELNDEKKIKTFFAPWDINEGDNLVLKIEEGLENSKFIGIIMSPDWKNSPWTQLERTAAVYDNPTNIDGKILPMLYRDCKLPPSIRTLKWYDFRTESNFEREIKKLIARIMGKTLRPNQQENTVTSNPKILSEAVYPDYQNEILTMNLFPVVKIPDKIFRSISNVESRSSIWVKLDGSDPPPFSGPNFENQRMLSFYDPSTNDDLKKITEPQSVEQINIDYALMNYPRELVELLNRCFTKLTSTRNLTYDFKSAIKKNFFSPINDDVSCEITRPFKWASGTRTVIQHYSAKPRFYAHQSFKGNFTIIGNELFLRILPGWHFTSDGLQAVEKERMASLSARWLNIERNHSLINHLRFWAYVISEGKPNIFMYTGSEDVVISSIPVTSETNVGIEEDYRSKLWAESDQNDWKNELEIIEDLGE